MQRSMWNQLVATEIDRPWPLTKIYFQINAIGIRNIGHFSLNFPYRLIHNLFCIFVIQWMLTFKYRIFV